MSRLNRQLPLHLLLALLLPMSAVTAHAKNISVQTTPSQTEMPGDKTNFFAANDLWHQYENTPGFQEALDEIGISYKNLINPQYASVYNASDVNNPLFWLSRTLRIYGQSEQGRYEIPVSELHEVGRNRTTSHARNNYFLTHVWGKKGESVTLRPGPIPENVLCSAAIDPNYDDLGAPTNIVNLQGEKNSTYTFSQDALLTLGCMDQTKTMANVDKSIVVEVVNGGTWHPLFIFGLNSRQEWRDQAITPTPSGYNFLFDGRARLVAPAAKAKASVNNNILQTLRDSLLRTITYDKLNGLDGSTWLHQPSRGLLFATYNSCCWATGGQGLTGIGFSNTIPQKSEWGEWHEYGHHYQLGWSWSGLTEITVNLYSLAACYTTLGDTDVKNCHTSSGLTGFIWDQQAIGTLLTSGKTWNFDTEDVFRRASLFGEIMTSWPQLFPQLGKAYREVNQADPASVDSSQEKIDWFVTNTSRIAGYNLLKYYQQWGVKYSQNAVNAVTALNLPQPNKVSKTYTASLKSSQPATLTIKPTENNYNVAFVTNAPKAGPTTLIWAEKGESSLYAQVVDDRNRAFIVKLRATTSHGSCSGYYTMNSAASCVSGDDTYLKVSWHPEDNLLLPQGSFKGVSHLIAQDWHNAEWTANVNINLEITK